MSSHEHDLLADTLAGGFRWLRFPASLEHPFVAQHARRSLDVIRKVLPWLTLLCAVSGTLMLLARDNATFDLWLWNALLPVVAALAWLWLALGAGLLTRAVHLQVAVAVGIALFATTRTVFLLGDTPLAHYVSYHVVFLLFIAFTVSRMRFVPALLTVSAAGAAAIAYALAMGLTVDWLAFSQYFVATSLLGGTLGYLLEYRDRGDWLKTRMLDLEKQEMTVLRDLADSEAKRQQQVGQYLADVAGNLTPTEIAGRTLRFLVAQTGAQVGTVYLADGEVARRAVCWGAEGEAGARASLARGEGLVGQALETGRRLHLTHLPADYLPVRSGLGAAAPASLLLEPVRQGNDVLAVIELGSLQGFGSDAERLLASIGEAMATTLVAARAREALARANMDEFSI